MLYKSARLRMHACICSAYEPRPYLFVEKEGGYNYLAIAEWCSYTSLPFFEDSKQLCDICGACGDTQAKVIGHVR